MDDFKLGEMLRSHDFEERTRPGRGACYVEGKLIGICEMMEGCTRYAIEVTREVWNGKEIPATAPFSKRGLVVHPPLNGTPVAGMDRVTNLVERIA
jgi:hypothetical protein